MKRLCELHNFEDILHKCIIAGTNEGKEGKSGGQSGKYYETTHELTLGVSYQSNSVAVCPATIEAGSASIPRAYASGI